MYEYDKEREEKNRRELERAFRKKIEDPHCRCVVLDACNERAGHFSDMAAFAARHGYEVLVGELPLAPPTELERRSQHKRSAKDIAEMVKMWEATPVALYRVDLKPVLEEMPSWIVS